MISLGQFTRRIVLVSTLMGALIACTNAAPDFSITTVKTVSLEQGKKASPGIRVLTAGSFSEMVSFGYTASGQLPSGMTLQFSPASSRAYTALNIATGETTPPGDYPITIKGVSLGLERTVDLMVKVLDKPFNVTLGSTAQVERGNTVDVPLTIVRRAGYSSKISFILDSANDAQLPEALKKATFVASDTDPDKGNLRFAVPLDLKAGDYSILLKTQGTSSGQTYEVDRTLTLSVVNPPNPDYTVSSSVSAFSFTDVGEQTATVTVSRVRGYSEQVTFDLIAKDTNGNLVPLPSGVSGSFTTVNANNTSTFTLKVQPGVLNGNYPLIVRGTSGTITRETPITVNINIQKNFLLEIESSFLTIRQGESFATNVSARPYAGYTGAVAFRIKKEDGSDAPAGITATFTPATVTLGGDMTTSMRISVARDVPISDSTAGNYYNLRVESYPADNPNDTPRVVKFKLNVLPDILPGMFIALPDSVTEILGNEFEIPTSIVRIGNFTADVNLNMPSPPSTFTNIRFTPKVLSTNQSSSTLNFTPDFTTEPKVYNVTVSASSGTGPNTITASGNVRVNVVDFQMGAPATQQNILSGATAQYRIGRPNGFGFIIRLKLQQKNATGNYVEVPASGNDEIESFTFGSQLTNEPYLLASTQPIFVPLQIKTKAGLAPKRLDLRVMGESATDMTLLGDPLMPIQRRYVELVLNIQ